MRLTMWLSLAGAAALDLSISPVWAERGRYSGVVAFGTSLSGSGNALRAPWWHEHTPGIRRRPALVPSTPDTVAAAAASVLTLGPVTDAAS
jgi:hypothetical protein